MMAFFKEWMTLLLVCGGFLIGISITIVAAARALEYVDLNYGTTAALVCAGVLVLVISTGVLAFFTR